MAEQLVQINVTGSRAGRLSYSAPYKAAIETVQIPEIKAENVLLKTLFSGISRGTESLVYAGKVPESEWKRMRCPFMSGSFAFPVTYGYACVCEVIGLGEKTSGLKPGDRVFVLHPHQDIFSVPESSCNLLPPSIPTSRAVLSANMETALNAVWDAEISGNPFCAIIGAGVVGLITAHAVRKVAGLDPVIFDLKPEKERHATEMGFRFINSSGIDKTEIQDFELIFHTSASAGGLQSAIDMAAFEAKIIEMSWYGENPVSLNLGGAFHSKRLKILSSQVGTIASAKRNKLDYAGRMQQAITLLDDPRLDTLLGSAIDFHDLPNHLHDIFSPQSDVLCQVIEYTH
ncbi:MAG: zinc-binding alcohol dehydrogenase [Pseudomonadota bacterium]